MGTKTTTVGKNQSGNRGQIVRRQLRLQAQAIWAGQMTEQDTKSRVRKSSEAIRYGIIVTYGELYWVTGFSTTDILTVCFILKPKYLVYHMITIENLLLKEEMMQGTELKLAP